MESTDNSTPTAGFQRGVSIAYRTLTAENYDKCMAEVRNIIASTEERGNSRSTYYNKLNGRTPLTIAEAQRLDEVFARYGIADWRGTESDNQ